MSDEKPREDQRADGQKDAQRPGAGLPKHTLEVEAVQIVEVETARRRPPPLPREKPSSGQEPTKTSSAETSARRYVLNPDGIPWHKLDYREAALLAQVDGERDRDAVITAAGLDAEEGMGLFDGLIDRRLIVTNGRE